MITYNEKLVKLVKAVGQELIDRAEDLVGTGDFIGTLDIGIHISNGKLEELPTITVHREHLSHRAHDLVLNNFEGGE